MIQLKILFFGILCSLVTIFLGASVLFNRKMMQQSRSVEREFPKMAVSLPKYRPVSSLLKPKKFTKFTQKMTEIALKCKNICSMHAGGICVPSDLAVFVYRKDLPTTRHTYDRSRPVIHLPLMPSTRKLPKTMDINDCLTEELFPDVELIPRQGSCAIVGNGGILLRSSCGQAIDRHNFVIRANVAPIVGFEADVGHKTNLTAFNTETLLRFSGSLLDNPRPDYAPYRDRYLNRIHGLNDSILWYLKHLRPPHDDKYRKITSGIRNFKNSRIRFAYSWKPISIEKSWNLPKRGTLGFDIVTVARTFCYSITVYGFYPHRTDPSGNAIQHHYYENVPDFNYNAFHDFGAEFKQLKDLNAKGELNLVIDKCGEPMPGL